MYYQPNAYFTGDKIQIFKLNKKYGKLTENIALYLISSIYRAWWKCSACKGEYQQTVKKKILMKESCPYCQNNEVLKGFNDLSTTHPWLIKEWSDLNQKKFLLNNV